MNSWLYNLQNEGDDQEHTIYGEILAMIKPGKTSQNVQFYILENFKFGKLQIQKSNVSLHVHVAVAC